MPHQIITKEIEVNEWKRKYEESRAEVFEMRYEAALVLWHFASCLKDITLQKYREMWTIETSNADKGLVSVCPISQQENCCRIREDSCTDDW